MTNTIFFFLVLLASSGAIAQDSSAAKQQMKLEILSKEAAPTEEGDCKRENSAEVIVCGHSNRRYRIDPTVLAATRAAEALPPKPPVSATAAEPCTGPNCGGGTIPLVGMALTALKAAELAADGDDWRDALRTHPDQYQVYEQKKNESKARVSFGLSAGNK